MLGGIFSHKLFKQDVYCSFLIVIFYDVKGFPVEFSFDEKPFFFLNQG